MERGQDTERDANVKKNGGLVGGFLGRHQRLAQHCVVEGLPKQVQESWLLVADQKEEGGTNKTTHRSLSYTGV
jgi:hypothetical protein